MFTFLMPLFEDIASRWHACLIAIVLFFHTVKLIPPYFCNKSISIYSLVTSANVLTILWMSLSFCIHTYIHTHIHGIINVPIVQKLEEKNLMTFLMRIFFWQIKAPELSSKCKQSLSAYFFSEFLNSEFLLILIVVS